MFATDYAAQILKVGADELFQALDWGHIQAEREAARSRDGAVTYQPVSPEGRLFRSIRDGYISPKILKPGKMED